MALRRRAASTPETDPRPRVVIVGLGGSGLRFARACLALSVGGKAGPRIIAGVDVSAARCASFEKLGIPCYDSIQAMRVPQPDLAIVATPEAEHVESLIQLRARYPGLRRVICEKPLAATAQDASVLRDVLKGCQLTLNFVERFSPAIDTLRSYMRANRRTAGRVNAFWGKYRVGDPRATNGVADVELSHPLDLALMLADIAPGTPFEIVSTIATASNFTVDNDNSTTLDTIHVALRFAEGLQVILATSLIWSCRRRIVEVVLLDEGGVARELAVLNFDDPTWDLDRLEILGVGVTGGRLTPITTMAVTAADWTPELLSVGKVARCITAAAGGAGETTPLPGLDHGIYIQQILERIDDAARRDAMTLPVFGSPADPGDRIFAREADILSALATGRETAPESSCWDARA